VGSTVPSRATRATSPRPRVGLRTTVWSIAAVILGLGLLTFAIAAGRGGQDLPALVPWRGEPWPWFLRLVRFVGHFEQRSLGVVGFVRLLLVDHRGRWWLELGAAGGLVWDGGRSRVGVGPRTHEWSV
jgi:hypothetical protein